MRLAEGPVRELASSPLSASGPVPLLIAKGRTSLRLGVLGEVALWQGLSAPVGSPSAFSRESGSLSPEVEPVGGGPPCPGGPLPSSSRASPEPLEPRTSLPRGSKGSPGLLGGSPAILDGLRPARLPSLWPVGARRASPRSPTSSVHRWPGPPTGFLDRPGPPCLGSRDGGADPLYPLRQRLFEPLASG
jgi:hypothetical protein